MTIIKFKNNSVYVQRKIDAILRIYRVFAKTYVNDIIVFNRILKKHFNYLRQIFQLLNFYDIRFSSKKSFLNYLIVVLFDCHDINYQIKIFSLQSTFTITIANNDLCIIINFQLNFFFHFLLLLLLL